MPAGSGSHGRSLRNNCDRVNSKAGAESPDGRNQSDACSKSPLLIMSPQETWLLPDSGEIQNPWADTPVTTPTSDALGSSPTVPFSLQEYLDDMNGLERCMAGMPEQGRCSRSRERRTTLILGPSPVAVPDEPGFTDSEYIEVDYEELASMRGDGAFATADDLGGVGWNAVEPSDSPCHSSGAASATSSSSRSSGCSILDPSRAPPSRSLRYESLHRQLQEAGLAGLGDGTNSIQLYNR
ncbi:uncharacterized protein MAM_07451 [Metarhizium album ARSEF 1941]|uniref:Uncharacterized protein n=1 Tax=Metarhizium album (strain ARSEF 1941) TaxID=1081103 RepID=A0A0B2WFI7_METAS|nr:uncharacterized protein MAM_07451 [Metarhizium album ARSEF 1941]KHN94696.1 hypothetical protein MAM_07451 [Metarhizium album ARSEF 1941]